MADLEQNQQPDNSLDNGPDQMQRPAQYPTAATKIDNGIAYDISGKQLGPVSGMEEQAADKNDDFFAKLGGKPVQAQQETKNDDFFSKLGGTPVQGSAQPSTPSAAAGQATGIGPRQSTTEHVSGGKDLLGREIEASPTAARHQWADWFQDLKGDLDNGTDATWVGALLRKAGAKGLAYGNSPEIGHAIGGPLYGPAMVGHGVSILQDRPAEGANEIIGGVGTTLGPLTVTQPEALPFMAIAGSTSKGVTYAAQQMGADPETAELIGNVAGLASGMKMVGKSHLVDKFESSTNTYMDAQKNYVGRLREFENASRQASAAEQEAIASRQLESQGQVSRQIRIETEEKASQARSNASKAQKALQQVSETRDQAGVQMRQVARQIQGTRTLQKMDARRTKELAGAHEDFKSMAPPTKSGPAAYTDNDLSIARGYLENSHSTKPLATVEDHFQALDTAQKSIDQKIDPYIQKYAAEPITSNIKMEVADKLAAQDKVTPGFLQKGLDALTKQHDLTDLSMKEADDLRETLNAANRDIMSKHFPGSIELGTKLKTDPEFAANYYAMEAIRDGIDGTLQDHGVDGIRDLRRDQASLIRVREATERQLQRGDQKVRGSGQSGIVRQAAAEATRKGAVGYGAAKAGPLGAIAGDYLGERLGRMFSPGDLTRDQLAERTMRVKGAGRPVNQMTGGEGTEAIRPSFETPPAPSTAMSPEDIQKIQRELSPLHGELATHYGEHIGDVSYEDLERQFMGDISDKQQHGVALEPAEKTLLGKINQQNAADALASKQAAQEAALKGKQVGQATLPENAGPALHIEGAPNGMKTHEVIEHELAHAVVGNEKGLPAIEVRSHNHPTNDNRGRYASVAVDWTEFEGKEGGLDLNKVRDRMPDLAATFVAGGVANDLWHNIPFTENEGLGSDISALRDFMEQAGFTKAETARMIAQAADDAAQVLQRPGVRDVIEQHAEVREPGLSNRLHFSEDRLQQVYQDIKGGANDATTGKSARTAREGNEGTGGNGTGREGKVQAGASEELRKESKGSSEGKAKDSRPDESRSSGAASSEPAVGQGGHAGGAVASEEELARPGRFVKISRSGAPTDQGKSPDFNLAAGEAGYQVKPDGTYELKSGQETPSTKRGVEGYAKEVFPPEDLAVSASRRETAREQNYRVGGVDADGDKIDDNVSAHSFAKAQTIAAARYPGFKQLAVDVTGESKPYEGYSVPSGKHLDTPNSREGLIPVEKTMRHELGHHMVGYNEGISAKAVLRHTHPEMRKGVNAAVSWDLKDLTDSTGYKIRPEKIPNVLRMLMGGVAADEAFSDIPRGENNNLNPRLGGDGTSAINILRGAGYQEPEITQMMHAAIDQAKQHLTHPAVSGIIQENVGVREPGLSRQYHYSGERLRSMGDEAARRIKYGTYDNRTASGESSANRPADVAGREGETAGAVGQRIQTPEVSAPSAKDVVEKEGLKYKGELVPGTDVHMFEHPDHPGKTAALQGPLTPESVRGKMDAKLKEFGVAQNPQIAAHDQNGGSTFTPEGENLAGKDLHAVGSYPERTVQVDKLTPEVLDKFKTDNADLLSQGDHAVGTWKDPDTGKAVLDISKTIANREEAIAAGKAANQKAIYHLGGNGEIQTGGTGEALPDLALSSPKGSTVPLMENPLKVKGTGDQGRITTNDVAKELKKFTTKQLPALEHGVAGPAEQIKRAKSIADDEAKYQLNQANSGKAWYTTDIADHDKILQDMRPELADPSKLSLFKMSEAILSSGQKPYGNLKAAIKAWDYYNETGEFSPVNPNTKQSWGPRNANAYGMAMDSLNKLIQEKGEKGASDWLLGEHPVKDLRPYMTEGQSPVRGKATDQAPGVMILGAKRGPFAQNLHSIESAFTADMWVNRTWNRWMGTQEINPDGELQDSPRNQTERGIMKQSFEHAANKLGLTTSSLQAVLWYYEQSLYGAHGVPKESWNFADAARRVQQEQSQGDLFETKQPGAVHALDFIKTMRGPK